MNKFNKFAAAAAAFALAATVSSCGAPEAITFGNSTKTALTVDGYDVPAGVFIYNEIYAYSSAAYELYSKNGEYPKFEDVKNATIESMDSTDWIQDKATEACRDFVANEREFAKIGESFTDEELTQIKQIIDSNANNTTFTENGIGSDSMRAVIENTYKQDHIFKHYYGLDKEKGCSEEELKEYYLDKTARIKYFAISLLDENGEKLGADELRRVNKMADEYVKEINDESTNLKKLWKIDECEKNYNDYVTERSEKAAAEAGVTTVAVTTTVTTTADSNATTTTTTTDPYANEVTITKRTTTKADDTEIAITTTTSVESGKSAQAATDYNDYVFEKLGLYKAEKYQYDENTVYIIIKGDLEERMKDDDLWSEDNINNLISERYYEDFQNMMKDIANGYTVDKNASAYRRYSPFKLSIE